MQKTREIVKNVRCRLLVAQTASSATGRNRGIDEKSEAKDAGNVYSDSPRDYYCTEE